MIVFNVNYLHGDVGIRGWVVGMVPAAIYWHSVIVFNASFMHGDVGIWGWSQRCLLAFSDRIQCQLHAWRCLVYGDGLSAVYWHSVIVFNANYMHGDFGIRGEVVGVVSAAIYWHSVIVFKWSQRLFTGIQ